MSEDDIAGPQRLGGTVSVGLVTAVVTVLTHPLGTPPSASRAEYGGRPRNHHDPPWKTEKKSIGYTIPRYAACHPTRRRV